MIQIALLSFREMVYEREKLFSFWQKLDKYLIQICKKSTNILFQSQFLVSEKRIYTWFIFWSRLLCYLQQINQSGSKYIKEYESNEKSLRQMIMKEIRLLFFRLLFQEEETVWEHYGYMTSEERVWNWWYSNFVSQWNPDSG